jgi:hypothetical protein
LQRRWRRRRQRQQQHQRQQHQGHRGHADNRRGSEKCSTYATRGSVRTGARTLRRAATRKAKRRWGEWKWKPLEQEDESDDEFCDRTTAPIKRQCPGGGAGRAPGVCGCAGAALPAAAAEAGGGGSWPVVYLIHSGWVPAVGPMESQFR